jgi:hypothetical protein
VTLNRSPTMGEVALRVDENVTEALVVSFPMIVGHKFFPRRKNRLSTQNVYLAANCRMRGSAALWIRPKVEDLRLLTGLLKFT